MIRHLIFDLDGTLLDTIEGIRYSINLALEKCGYPYRYDRRGTMALVGDGADECIRRSLQEKGADLQAFNAVKAVYMPLYRDNQIAYAFHFDGLFDVLKELKKRGFDFCCVTNKPDPLAQAVLAKNFGPDFFRVIYGQSDRFPRKPDPAMVDRCIEQFGFRKEECAYVGDSHVDIDTGHNAGLPVVLCTYGYELDYGPILPRAEYVVNRPEDLLRIFE